MLSEEVRRALRDIPSISELIEDPLLDTIRSDIAPKHLTTVARQLQEQIRREVRGGNAIASSQAAERLLHKLERMASTRPTSVINGTGIIIHTNLGRSPVSRATAEAMSSAATRYLPLEVDRETGRRGGRGREVTELLHVLTGCEDALIVNNNAAAVTLTLSALADSRGVIVSRGEAVEIGGGFRIPDVLRESGARLVEVGTTNRTYLRDYEAAIDEETAALMKVHASNFAIIGFTAQPTVGELAQLAHDCGLYCIEDAGSGCLVNPESYGLGREPVLSESIASGVDVMTASGDKLLGGPQAGLILGKKEAVERIRRHPLARAVRVDKTVQAGIAATLRHYLRGDFEEEVPIWWSISRDHGWLEERVIRWIEELDVAGVNLIETESAVGGGSLPGQTLPSCALALRPKRQSADDLARALRIGRPSVFARIVDDIVAVDARTVLADEDQALIDAIRAVYA